MGITKTCPGPDTINKGKGAVTWSDNLLVGEAAHSKCQTKHPGHFQSCCKSVFFQTTSLLCLLYPSPSLTPVFLFSPQASVFSAGLHPQRCTKLWIISFQTDSVRPIGNLPISRYSYYLWDKMVSFLSKQWGSHAISPLWIIFHFFPSFMVCHGILLRHLEIRKRQGISLECWQTAEVWLVIVADLLPVQYCRLTYICNMVMKEN